MKTKGIEKCILKMLNTPAVKERNTNIHNEIEIFKENFHASINYAIHIMIEETWRSSAHDLVYQRSGLLQHKDTESHTVTDSVISYDQCILSGSLWVKSYLGHLMIGAL